MGLMMLDRLKYIQHSH